VFDIELVIVFVVVLAAVFAFEFTTTATFELSFVRFALVVFTVLVAAPPQAVRPKTASAEIVVKLNFVIVFSPN
jgi:hypothetical protein